MATLQQLQETLIKADKAGNTEDATQLAEAIRQHPTYRKQGEDALKLGFKGVKGKDRRRAVQNAAAKAMGLKSGEVDIDSGIGMWERTKLDLLRDDASRMDYLEKKFGSENVAALNIKGKLKMFYRDPKSNKMTMVDEMRLSLADITADISGEVATVAGSVVGAAKGAAMGSAVGPLGMAAGAITGAATGHLATGMALDVGSEIAAGQDVQLGDIAAQRGIEAAIGVPIDLATLYAGKFISRGIAGKSARKLIEEFDVAASRVDKMLAKEGERLVVPPSLRTGLGSKKASQLAAARPSSKVAKELQATRDNIATIKESLRGRGKFGVSREEFNIIADRVSQNYSKIVSEIESIDKTLAKELKDQISRRIRLIHGESIGDSLTENNVGKMLRETLAPEIDKIKLNNAKNFAILNRESIKVNVPIKSILNHIENAKKQFSRFKDPESTGIYNDLKKRLDDGVDKVSFKEFREIMDEINEVVSRNKDAGFTTKERVASRVFDNLIDLRNQVLENNQFLKKIFNETFDYYQQTHLGTKRSMIGRSFREQLAAPSMTNEQVARAALQDSEHVRQVFNLLGESRRAPLLRVLLQDLYLNKIGIKRGVKSIGKGFDFNDDIVRELWGERKLRQLHNLKNRIIQSKDVKIEELRPEDVEKYLTALTREERSNIYRSIRQRQVRGEQVDTLKNSIIIKKLLPTRSNVTGHFLEPEFTGMSLVDFSDSFVAASNSEVRKAIKALKMQDHPIGLQAFRQSYIGNLLKRFSGGSQTDRFGNPLWNPVSFAENMKRGKLRNNAVTILGKDGLDDLLAANKVLLEAAESKGGQVAQILQPRYSFTKGGLQLYGVGNILGGIRGNVMALAYGSKIGSLIMRFLANPATDAEAEAMLKKIIPALFTTDRGIQAIAIQSQIDPEFKEKIAPLVNAQPKE